MWSRFALDPTATIAVTGSDDGTVRAGPVTGEEPHLFYGHKGTVYAVAVSPDGRWIASGGQDGTQRLAQKAASVSKDLPTTVRDASPTSPSAYRTSIAPRRVALPCFR
jgi:WD40 repeat protein